MSWLDWKQWPFQFPANSEHITSGVFEEVDGEGVEVWMVYVWSS